MIKNIVHLYANEIVKLTKLRFKQRWFFNAYYISNSLAMVVNFKELQNRIQSCTVR